MWEGIVREFGMDMYTLIHLKWITNEDLLDSTGTFSQCYVAAWLGGVSGGSMDICICMAESLCCSPETNHLKVTIVNRLYSNTK